jgi:hypothetical protein
MKRIVFIILILVAPLKAFSQISSGSVIVGGEFSLSLSKDKSEQGGNTDDGPARTYFSIIPNVEYFLADNLSAGIGIGYKLNRSKSENSTTEIISKDGLFTIAPYLKKYFSLGDKAYFYGQAIASFGFGKETTETKSSSMTISVEENSSNFSIGIVPGFRYDISDKVGLEAGVGFFGFSQDVDKSKNGNNERRDITNTFSFRLVPNALSLGIRYTIK